MDKRLFFMIGDLVANVVSGTIAGLAAWAIVDPAWNMWLAMLAMMVLGMALGLVLFFPFSIKLGAMEVMLPLMFSGMLGGMVVGMLAAMVPLSLASALAHGAVSGLAGILCIWIANSMLLGIAYRSEGN